MDYDTTTRHSKGTTVYGVVPPVPEKPKTFACKRKRDDSSDDDSSDSDDDSDDDRRGGKRGASALHAQGP
jgi:hypothetical protein